MTLATAKLLLVPLAVASVLLPSCSYKRIPGRTVETASRYDTRSRKLTLLCKTATEGRCRIFVENRGKRQVLYLAEGTTQIVGDIDPAARTCAMASVASPATCTWTPVL